MKMVPKLGPLDIEIGDWQMLVRHVKAFSRDFDKALSDPSKADPAFMLDVYFAVVKDEVGLNRILVFPVSLGMGESIIPNWIRGLKNPVAFGVVRGMENFCSMTESDANSASSFKERAYSIRPSTSDVKLSVEIDKTVGRPLYHVIMNRNFEYEIYRNDARNLYALMKPIDEDAVEPVQ